MPNAENLIPNHKRTPNERRANASKAGKASAEARRRRKTFREMIEVALSAKGASGREVGEDVVLAMIESALAGDVKAATFLRDTIGEKPVEKAKVESDGEIRISWKKSDGH